MEYEGYLSEGQYATLVIVTALSSFLSILGSVAVTRIAFLKMTSTYQRFLFMLSLADILNSVFLLFHQLVLPSSPDFYWAVGNNKTCSMAGFFLHFGSLSVAMYSCYLSMYFYLSIQSSPKRQKQPEDIIGSWEWCAHLSCFLIPGGIAVAAAVTDNLDVAEGLGLCVIQSYDCEDGTTDEVDCVPSGNNGWALPKDTNALRWAYVAGMIAAASFAILATALVYFKVQGTLTQRGDSGADGGALPDEMKQRLRAVATQAILYTGVFVNTLIWPVLAIAIPTDTKAPVYFLQFLAFLLYPLQGVFNCFIYIRPRYQMLSAMYPDDSMMVVFRVSMSKAGDPDEIEEVRERVYGDDYQPPSVASSEHSLASDMPAEVAFDPSKPLSRHSLVSVPADDDDMDPEAVPKDDEEEEEEEEEAAAAGENEGGENDDAKST
jgi:hypothetical protein